MNFTSYDTLIPEITPITEGTEGYLIQFPTDQMGYYEFIVTASCTGYQSDAIQFTLFWLLQLRLSSL